MFLRRKLMILVAVVASAAMANAQDWTGVGRVEGTVKDEQGNPIAEATVSMRWTDGKGPDIKVNSKGRWARMGLNGGAWSIDFSAPGFETRSISYNVSQASRNEPINMVLKPAVKKEAPHEELSIGGKKVTKETADAIEKANAAWNAKNWAEARAGFEKVLVDLPDNANVLEHVELACYNGKQYDDALTYAQKLVAIDPANTNSWLMIAEIDLQKGNLDAGKAALEKVPDEKILDPAPYLNMGINYYNKNRSEDAETWFTKAITKSPESADNADAYYYRGLVRFTQKHMEDAKADFAKYLLLAPTGANAETINEILKSLKPRTSHKTPSHG